VEKWAGVRFKTPEINVTEMGGWRSSYAYDFSLYTPEVLHGIFAAAGAHVYTAKPSTLLLVSIITGKSKAKLG
jgi:hypothetical protein